LRLLSQGFENLVEPLHVVFGLAQVALESLLELRIAGFLDHLGQRLHDLFLGIVDVAQGVHEQVVHALNVLRKESHVFRSLVCDSWSWQVPHLGLACPLTTYGGIACSWGRARPNAENAEITGISARPRAILRRIKAFGRRPVMYGGRNG
jgi:hypothetical protein